MTTSNIKTGSCLCGKIQVSITPENTTFDACHCGICRKWSGGPALTVDGGKNITFQGEEFISRYDSSAWAQRGFCKNCGTHLFYHLKNSNYYNSPFGLLENVEEFKFQMQFFIDKKPSCYEFSNKTEKLTETEVMEKFGPPPTK